MSPVDKKLCNSPYMHAICSRSDKVKKKKPHEVGMEEAVTLKAGGLEETRSVKSGLETTGATMAMWKGHGSGDLKE